MKTIIAGSRTINDYEKIKRVIELVVGEGLPITEVVCGGARGVDQLGAFWAKTKNIPVMNYPADWTRNGRQAGILRNIKMAKNAEALLAIWDGDSKGTEHMIREARRRGLTVVVVDLRDPRWLS